jgi:ubiquinone/menaquinone biosynthesis C-methylase UbiE
MNYSASYSELGKQYKDASNLSARQRIYRFAKVGGEPWPRWVFDRLELPRDARVLELGCGNGFLWKANADRIPAGWKIVLTDASQGMVDEARRALGDVPRRFAFQRVGADSLPFPDAIFDGVIANHMLYHLPDGDRDRAIGEVHRVLCAGGVFHAATNGERHLRQLKDLIDAFVALPEGMVWRTTGRFGWRTERRNCGAILRM